MTEISSIVYDYDRSMLAKALGYDISIIDVRLLMKKLLEDKTLESAVNASKTVYFVGSCLGIITNLFCILVLTTMKGSLKTSLRLVLSLSVSDAVRSISDVVWYFFKYDTVRIPSATVQRSNSGINLRRMMMGLYLLADLSGLLTIFMLAVVIFLAVKNPLSYNTLMTKRNGNGIILFVWATSGLLTISYHSVFEVLKRNSATSDIPVSFIQANVYIYMAEIYTYFTDVIFILILGLNIAIFIQVKINTVNSTNSRRLYRLAVVLVLIIFNYFITCMPIILHVWNDIYTPKELYFDTFRRYFVACSPLILQGCRSIMNSMVYTMRLPELQKQVKKIIQNCIDSKDMKFTHPSSTMKTRSRTTVHSKLSQSVSVKLKQSLRGTEQSKLSVSK